MCTSLVVLRLPAGRCLYGEPSIDGMHEITAETFSSRMSRPAVVDDASGYQSKNTFQDVDWRSQTLTGQAKELSTRAASRDIIRHAYGREGLREALEKSIVFIATLMPQVAQSRLLQVRTTTDYHFREIRRLKADTLK